MEESSTKTEEDVSEKKTSILNIYGPCHFLQEALGGLLSCLGFVAESNTCSDEHQKSSQSTSTTQEQAADPLSTAADVQQNDSTTQTSSEVSASELAGRRPPRPGLSGGRDPQIN